MIISYLMRFDFDFYSSFLLVFFVHTVVYSFLFFLRYFNQKQVSNLWLGLFLILAALYIAPWMLGFAGWYVHQPYRDIMFYIPFQHLFLIGPCVFFYVKSLFNPQERISRKDFVHFIPSILYCVYSIIVVTYDKLIVNKYYFLKSQEDPDLDDWYQITGFISMFIYFLASIRYYNLFKIAIREVISNSADFLFLWVRNFLIAFLIILTAWLVLEISGLFIEMPFSLRWWYFLSFALCCYYIAIAGYSNAVETRIFFKTTNVLNSKHLYLLQFRQPQLLDYKPLDFEVINPDEIRSPGSRNTETFAEKKAEIEILLSEKKIYQQPELSLFDVAEMLNTNISFLSKVINTSFGMNFNDLVNSYRVQSVIDLLNAGKHLTHTLLSIAFESGFNSKATFNRVFKKSKGINPQKYIEQFID